MSDFNDNFFKEDDCKDDDRKDRDSKSACTLKDIIRDLDKLNNRDLRLLDALIDRILRCRSSHHCDC